MGRELYQILRLDHVLGTLNDILRSCIELLDQLLYPGARQWRDRDFHLLGISEELRVLYRVVEGLAQNVDLLRRRASRCDIGALEYLLADHQFGHFAVLILDVVPDRGNAHFGQLRLRLERDLHQHVELLVAQPVGLLRLDARPVPAADAVYLAALHGERDVGRAGIAGNDLEFGTCSVIVERRIVAGGATGGAAADDRLLFLRVLEGLDLGILEGRADAHPAIGGADIDHLGRIELQVGLLVQQRPDDGARHQRPDGISVLGRGGADVDSGARAAGAGHVLDEDIGIAGNVPVHVAGDGARIDVVATAGIAADDELDSLAGIIVCRLRRCDRERDAKDRRPEAWLKYCSRVSHSELRCTQLWGATKTLCADVARQS